MNAESASDIEQAVRAIPTTEDTQRSAADRGAAWTEKVFVEINGVRQGMFIQCTDTAHPVLLYLHGGMPEFFLTERYPTGLETDFTMVWWDQRGAGLSFRPDIPRESMTCEQFIADTVSVSRHLKERFNQEKIYLLGHSGGSFIGLQAAARNPELYHAYIGVAQMVHQLESERRAYVYMLREFVQRGDDRMVRKLQAAPVTLAGGAPDAYLAIRDVAMHRLGIGTTHEMTSVVRGIVWQSLTSHDYTLGEKVQLWRGKHSAGVSALWQEMLATDLGQRVTELAVPAFFLHGVYDYTVNYELAKEFVARLRAPRKEFYTFDRSAHSPNFEEPERTRRILREDVLGAAQPV